MREQTVGIRQSAVRRRVLRVLRDRLLEELDRLDEPLFRALIEVIPSLQIQIVRGEVFDRLPLPAGSAVPQALGLEAFDDGVRDRVLRLEAVAKRRVDGFRPEVTARRGVDEMGRDADAVVRSPHAAAQRQPRRLSLVRFAGVGRDDAETFQPRQPVNQLLGQTGAEVGEIAAFAVIGKRGHRHRVPARERIRGRRLRRGP